MSTNPYLQGYGAVFNKNAGKLLGQIPGFQNTVGTRMAAIGFQEEAKNQIANNWLKMRALGVESQQPQEQGGMDWLGLAKTGLNIAGGLGAFGGGGGGMSFADGMNSGLPSFGDYSGIPSGGWGIPFG